MAAASVSLNLSQDTLEKVDSQVRVFMEAAQVQAMEEGCDIKSMLQLVDTLKGVHGLKGLDEKLDSVLDELKTIHKYATEMKAKMHQQNLSSFLRIHPMGKLM